MSWDNNNGPWGQPPKPNKPKNNKPASNGSGEDIDEIIRKGQEKVKNIFSGRGGNGGGEIPPLKPIKPYKAFALISVILLGLWFASGIYTVNTKEEGVVLRFGEYVRTAKPGINYRLPTPIERVTKLNVTERRSTKIGYKEDRDYNNRPSRNNDTRDILMLTGDENIVDVSFEVQWQIVNGEKYLFNVDNPGKTVRDSAESAMREVVGTTPLNDILSEGRDKVQLETKDLLQSVLDSYEIGIEIEEISLKAVPPRNLVNVDDITVDENGEMRTRKINITVDDAFKDVQAAKLNKEGTINSAIARSNELIPQARGEAQKLLQDAKGHKEKVIALAEGEAKRFTSVYNEYRVAKDITKTRIYLETMEEVLNGMDKIILDTEGGSGVVPYLPLNELNKKR